MKVAKSYKIIFLILAFIMSTMLALGMMKTQSVYADSKVSATSYFNLNGATATFTNQGLEIEAKDNVEVSFKNNLIVSDMSMKMKLPEGFMTTINVSLSSFYTNGNPKEWSKNSTDGTHFDTTIKNTLVLKYKDSSNSVVEGTLNGKAIGDIQVEDGFIVVNFTIQNNYFIVNGNDVLSLYNNDEKIYYKVKDVDGRVLTSKIAIELDTFVEGDTTVGQFVLEYVDQKKSDLSGDYKQSLKLLDGQTALTSANKVRVYLGEAFYLKKADGNYTSVKKAYDESYSLSYKACSLLGDNVSSLCLVNPNDIYDVILESSTAQPDRIRFNKTSNGKFGVGKVIDGQPVVFEEFEVDTIYDTNYKDEDAPVYVYDEIAYASFLNLLEDQYTVTKDDGRITSAGLGTRIDIPSMKDLVFDNFYSYESLNVKVYYKNQSESSTSTQMMFSLNEIGDYVFFVAFSDDADNTMDEKDFITEKDNVVTNGIYGEDSTVANYVGNFVFKFEIEDNADIIVKAPEVQGNGFKGVEYKASRFIIDADGCRKTYKLYYNANINADVNDANWIEIVAASSISEEEYQSNGFSYDEVMKVNYDGELKFVPTRIGAYKIECTATSSVSARYATNSSIIKVDAKPNVVEVPSKWLENNIWSVVFLSVGTLSLIGIIVLLCIKPKDQTDNEN